MKQIVKLLVVGALMFAGFACEQPTAEPSEPTQLEVTPNNISGSWSLTKWNGAPLAQGLYVYIDFVRSDRTFTMYQNTDSHSPRAITGRYFIYVDEELGVAVLRGEYDHGAGEWNHRYIVESLTSRGMTLVAKDDPTERCEYTRVEIPAEIVGN